GRAGIDLRTLQELAGHSTPALTARYSHRRLHDLAGAVEKLPRLLPEPDAGAEADGLRATGTDASTVADSAYTLLTHNSGPERDGPGLLGTRAGGGGENAAGRKPLPLQGVATRGDSLALPETRAGDRIRTGDVQLGKRATLSVQKPTEVLRDKSLWQIASICKVMRGLARISEHTRYFRASAGRNPVVTSCRRRASICRRPGARYA